MPQIKDVMTSTPVTVEPSTTAVEAARLMTREDVGPLPVVEGQQLVGIVTDRDLVVRGLAGGLLPHSMLEDVCSRETISVAPDDDAAVAVRLMRDHAVRRLPVVELGRVVGIVSLGDLAVRRDPDSVLAAISSAPAQR